MPHVAVEHAVVDGVAQVIQLNTVASIHAGNAATVAGNSSA